MYRRLQLSAALFALLSLVWAVAPLGARAQVGQAVTTLPAQATTAGAGNVSGTLAAGATFQTVFASAAPNSSTGLRRGCSIQNNGTHNMYVTEGKGVAGSTTSNSIILPPTYIYTCNSGGAVLYGEIDIAGTISEAFYAAQW